MSATKTEAVPAEKTGHIDEIFVGLAAIGGQCGSKKPAPG